MNQLMRMAAAVAALALAWSGTAQAQTQPALNLEALKPKIEQVIQAEIDKGTASVSIVLVEGDRIIWSAAYGNANETTATPATPATVYSTGSTSKSVTATAVMQLVEQGKIDLDSPVNRYLPAARVQDRLQVEDPVTVRHMLSHASGLTCDVRTVPLFSRTLPPDLAELTERTYSVRAPGEKYEYCNAAYGILGYLLEEVSGQEYESFIVENILKPLGSEDVAPVRPTAKMADLMARPYDRGEDGNPEPTEQVLFDVYPAGDLYMTATDMARYLGAHLNGGAFGGKRILSADSVAEMQRNQSPTPDSPYGFGFAVLTAPDGHKIITHTGSVPGFNAFLGGDVTSRLGVYLMTNSAGHQPIGRAVLELMRGAPIEAEETGLSD
ncbi:serine hydrolase domain-containing protein [Pacificimonas sp. ICDLI1SI03]